MSELADHLRDRIRAEGPLPFAEFMRLALFHPAQGYYERTPARIGRAGDFVTSVSVGPLFGELLALAFAGWFERADCLRPRLIEAGAHDGRLLHDLLTALRELRPGLFQRLSAVVLEPSERRRGWQRERLREFEAQVTWLPGVEQLAPGSVDGVIFSNELLDALVVHRLGWDASERAWFEWQVEVGSHGFVWAKPRRGGQLVPLSPQLQQALAVELGPELATALPSVLPDGYTIDARPAAVDWWRRAAAALGRGWLVTLDYGFTREEAFRPERTHGTLRAYHGHRAVEDPLAEPGACDLTAHVHFTPLIEAGEAAGLQTVFHGSQAQFLAGIVAGVPATTGDAAWWTPARRRQFQTLTHPQHFGTAFKVLAQSHGSG